jgi:formylglycine-generating enzyme required for sulfatase activity
MRHVIRLTVFVCCGLVALDAGPAHAEKRVALVIGNSAYRTVTELPNPKKDARDVAAALRGVGFAEVMESYDLGVRDMQQALSVFEDRATGADWAVVYYAGHGIEVDGRNYLVPVDAELKRASDVEDETLALDRVLARAAGAGRLQLVILDACRDNPFKRRMVQTGGAKCSVGERGLARIEPTHPNVVVAYAARDGEAALDGRAGENSPYTRALVKHLAEPGLELGRFFRKVRDEVLAATGGNQRPFEYGSLTGQDLFFRPAPAALLAPSPAPAPVSPSRAEVAQFCQSVAGNPSLGVVQSLLEAYRGTPLAPCIEARIDELKRIEESKKVAVVTPPAPPGRVFRDCADCPEMVVVPAGSFMMGSPASEEDRDGDEGPQHWVTIARLFAVGKFEVTFAEWDACVASGGCSHRPDDEGMGRGRRPVMNVSWDAITEQYLPWLSRTAGKTYRLLSEAEWEYAARAATTTPFSTGQMITSDQANFDDRSRIMGIWRQKTVEVGSFQPNSFGVHDMHGNVSEWVEDCVNYTYRGAPLDGSAWKAGICGLRVSRGGAWGDRLAHLRSSDRTDRRPGARSQSIGFRVATTL